VFYILGLRETNVRYGEEGRAQKEHHSEEEGGSCDLLPGKHFIQIKQFASVVGFRPLEKQSLKRILQKHRTVSVYIINCRITKTKIKENKEDRKAEERVEMCQ